MARSSNELKKLLRATARKILQLLEDEEETALIWLWEDIELEETFTGGWHVELGGLGKNNGSPCIEVWLDRFSGAKSERYYAGFFSRKQGPVRLLVDQASKNWKPTHTLTANDICYGRRVRLKRPLDQNNFGKTIEEHHCDGELYYGFYDPIEPTDPIARERFAKLAAAFILDVARSRNDAFLFDGDDDYLNNPKIEKRFLRLHSGHDRNKVMAQKCKERDSHICRICGLRYDRLYGPLGKGFAECHHIRALHTLKENEPTNLDDLITVCANCHRMLHRMDGTSDDVEQLARIVRSRIKRGSDY